MRFTTFVHLPGVEPKSDVTVKAHVGICQNRFDFPTTANQSAIIKLVVRAVATKEITVVTDVAVPALMWSKRSQGRTCGS